MNYGRIAAAAVVAWIVSLPVGFFVNDIVLAGVYAANSATIRGDADMLGKLPLGFGFLLLAYFAFAYAYAKGYEGGSGLAEGVRFGLTTAIIVIGFGLIWTYVMVPITGSLAVAMVVDALIELPIYGAIVGAIYKPMTPGPAM